MILDFNKFTLPFAVIAVLCFFYSNKSFCNTYKDRLRIVSHFIEKNKNSQLKIKNNLNSDVRRVTLKGYVEKLHLKIENCNDGVIWNNTNAVKLAGFEPINLEFNWNEDPYGSRTWQMYYHSFTFLKCGILNPQNSKRISALMLDWHQKNLPVETSAQFYMKWDDHTISLRLMMMAAFLKKNFKKLAPNDGNKLLDYLFVQMKLSISSEYFRVNHNHGLFQAAAVLYSIPLFPKHITDHLYQKSIRLINRYIDYSFTDAGTHKEHSPLYQGLMIRHLKALQDDQFPFSPSKKDVLSLAKTVLDHFTLPNGSLIPLGDTEYINGNKKEFEFNQSTCSASAIDNFSYLSSRKRGFHFSINNNFFSRTHKHNDNLAIHYQENGIDWIIDPGMAPYKNNGDRKRCKSQKVHSVPIINGLTDRKFLRTLAGTSTAAKEKSGLCIMKSKNLRPGYWVSRTVKWLSRGTFMVTDSSDSNVLMGARFNINPKGKSVSTLTKQGKITIVDDNTKRKMHILSCENGRIKLRNGIKNGAFYFPNLKKEDSWVIEIFLPTLSSKASYLITHDDEVTCKKNVSIWKEFAKPVF